MAKSTNWLQHVMFLRLDISKNQGNNNNNNNNNNSEILLGAIIQRPDAP